jgi:hypothetical protein
MQNNFIRKGYGRIYVFNKDKVQDVVEAIKIVDSSEFFYMPENLVAPYDGEVQLIYTHKFEIDINALTKYCWDKGNPIWCISQYNEV